MAIDLTPNGVPGSSYDDFGLKSSSVSVPLTGVSANANRGDISVKRVVDPFSDLGPSARPTGLYSFSNQITVELGGRSTRGFLGTMAVTGDANVALTGQFTTSSLGSITAKTPVVIELTTLAGTTGLGSLTLAYDWTESLTGTEGSGTLGDIVLGVTLETLVGTTALGSLSLTTSSNVELTSVVGTIPNTSLSVFTDQVITPTGNAATSGLGTITPIAETVREVYSDLSPMGTPSGTYTFAIPVPVTVSIDGVEATAAVATFDAWTVQHQIDGITGTVASGALTTTQGVTETLTTLAGTTSLGTLVVPETLTLTGVSGSARLGGISAQGDDVSIELGGLEVNGAVGTVSLSTDQVITPTGVAATGTAASLIFDEMIGVEGVTSLGTLTDTQGSTVTLLGVNTAAKTGFIVGTRTDTVIPLYFRCGLETEPRYNSVTMRNWTQLDASVDNEPLRAGVEIRAQTYSRVEMNSVVEQAVLMDKAA